MRPTDRPALLGLLASIALLLAPALAHARQAPKPAPPRTIVRPTSQLSGEPRPPARIPALPVPAGPVKTFNLRGKTYRAIPTADRGESEAEDEREREREARAALPAARGANDGEHFAGVARKDAKTSFAGAPTEPFSTISDILDSILGGASPQANDDAIRPTLNADSPRSSIEMRNVTVTAYLYATKKETDNDFHLLLGDAPGVSGRYMTSEVSGLPVPDDADTPTFQAARDAYKAFFQASGMDLPGSRYVRFDPPVPVTITGSLFFDVDHKIGEVGTGDIKPETVWEIHPVSVLTFTAAAASTPAPAPTPTPTPCN